MQVMKNRDGEKANSIDVQVDYATSMFTAPQTNPDQMGDLLR
jgi:hypothetical protein